MSKYLICFVLIALTGCATANRGVVTTDLPGYSKSVSGKKAASAVPDSPVATETEIAGNATPDNQGEPSADDMVTAEDMKLLSGADQNPPDKDGDTNVNDEVGFDLPVVENAKVRYFIEYFTGPAHQGFQRWLERSGRYLPMMREVFAEEGLPLDLSYLAMIESGFNTRAISSARAVGPWQFMKGTGLVFGLDDDWWRDERRDPVKATRAAARYLHDLHRHFGDWCLAIAAYNAGAGSVERAIKKVGSRDFWKLSHSGYLRKETRLYVPKLFAALVIAKDPEKYGFTDLDYLPPLEYDVVKLPSSTDLDIIARLSGVSCEEIRDLNPELNRWCTPPGLAGYPVRLPAGKLKSFKRRYAKIDPEHRSNFRRHRIESGDTLYSLARHYGIRAKDIIALNKIRNPRALRLGRNLILPLRPGATPATYEVADNFAHNKQRTYKVRKGDNLWTISRRFNVSSKQLCSWNGMQKKDTLKPGQVLLLAGSDGQDTASTKKVAYRVRPGDTLWDIGRRYNLKASEIREWNNLEKNHVLQPGDKITLKLPEEQNG
ncbi:MAG: LysM peptidoglycan-binding domain-containing protein [Geobacteraceae bacterium]